MLDMCFKTRGVSLGMDRFRRRYWAVPSCGGVYVEGAESTEGDDFEPLLAASRAADLALKEAAREEAMKLGELKPDTAHRIVLERTPSKDITDNKQVILIVM